MQIKNPHYLLRYVFYPDGGFLAGGEKDRARVCLFLVVKPNCDTSDKLGQNALHRLKTGWWCMGTRPLLYLERGRLFVVKKKHTVGDVGDPNEHMGDQRYEKDCPAIHFRAT